MLLAPAVDITELWWEGLTPAEQRDARDTGFVPLGGEYKVKSYLSPTSVQKCNLPN